MFAEIIAEVFSTTGLFTLVMLLMLQAVLGFDNLLYISIESKRTGPENASKVARWGIGLAVAFRIILLVIIVNIFTLLAEPLFEIQAKGFLEGEFTFQALITILGGAFILYTAIKEINHLLSVEHIEHSEGGKGKSVAQAIAMIVAMNLVFSFDSILSAMAIANIEIAQVVNTAGDTLTAISSGLIEGGLFEGTVQECKTYLIANPVAGAVGCEPSKDYQVWLMGIAIVLSGILMIFMADYVAEFLKRNRMYEVLGLFILFLVGVLLVTEGAHLAHLKLFGYPLEAMSKSSFYLVVGVLVITDIITNRYQKRLWAQKEAEILGADPAVAGAQAAEAHMAGKGH